LNKPLDEPMRDTSVEARKETIDQTMERLMACHGDGLTRLCYMMLNDRALAEDAVQETFFRAYRAYDRFRHDSSEYTWLTRIAINCCRSQRTKAWFRLEEQRANPEDIPGRHANPDMPDDTVLQAVMALTPKYKDPVLLHYYQGLPVKDIARILHVAVSTVSVRLMRARTMLKDALEEWYHDE
jgi:RNA polymerase sigma factor (sigma-70 family)